MSSLDQVNVQKFLAFLKREFEAKIKPEFLGQPINQATLRALEERFQRMMPLNPHPVDLVESVEEKTALTLMGPMVDPKPKVLVSLDPADPQSLKVEIERPKGIDEIEIEMVLGDKE